MSAPDLSVSFPGCARGTDCGRISLAGLIAVLSLHLVPLALLAVQEVRVEPGAPTLMVEMVVPQAVSESPPRTSSATVPKAGAASLAAHRRQPSGVGAARTEAPIAEGEPAADSLPATPASPVAIARSAPPNMLAPRYDAAYLNNPAPDYPAMSRRLGEEGKVVLRVLVAEDGRPAQIEIRSSSGSPRLDQAALMAVSRWQFVAARRGEELVAAWVLVPLAFNLRG